MPIGRRLRIVGLDVLFPKTTYLVVRSDLDQGRSYGRLQRCDSSSTTQMPKSRVVASCVRKATSLIGCTFYKTSTGVGGLRDEWIKKAILKQCQPALWKLFLLVMLWFIWTAIWHRDNYRVRYYMPRNHSKSRDQSDCDKPRARARSRYDDDDKIRSWLLTVWNVKKEVADVIADIRLEYGNKRQEAFKQKQEHQ
ncbi:hypothetical protein Tco_0652146 [Tanacetum coccineum]|uniref:Uncharacterized protein n=1 Tax=Tanacetum coccineum TaxID=301880 RepID=A0ABQ4WWR5_9ASTR